VAIAARCQAPCRVCSLLTCRPHALRFILAPSHATATSGMGGRAGYGGRALCTYRCDSGWRAVSVWPRISGWRVLHVGLRVGSRRAIRMWHCVSGWRALRMWHCVSGWRALRMWHCVSGWRALRAWLPAADMQTLRSCTSVGGRRALRALRSHSDAWAITATATLIPFQWVCHAPRSKATCAAAMPIADRAAISAPRITTQRPHLPSTSTHPSPSPLAAAAVKGVAALPLPQQYRRGAGQRPGGGQQRLAHERSGPAGSLQHDGNGVQPRRRVVCCGA
jgi:hypothetical protein